MIKPDVLYYAVLSLNKTKEIKSIKYYITKEWGYFPPMEELRGRDGLVSMYLTESDKSGVPKSDAPAMRLQAKSSLNFTGLKDWFDEAGRLSGYAYGYPSKGETYSSKNKPNPFFKYSANGYLFVIHQDENAPTAEARLIPDYIELLVLDGAAQMIASYRKQALMGGFDDVLKYLRSQAKSIL